MQQWKFGAGGGMCRALTVGAPLLTQLARCMCFLNILVRHACPNNSPSGCTSRAAESLWTQILTQLTFYWQLCESASCSQLRAVSFVQSALCSQLRAVSFVQSASCSQLRAVSFVQSASCSLQSASSSQLRAVSFVQSALCRPFSSLSRVQPSVRLLVRAETLRERTSRQIRASPTREWTFSHMSTSSRAAVQRHLRSLSCRRRRTRRDEDQPPVYCIRAV